MGYLGWTENASFPLYWQFLFIILDLLILDLNCDYLNESLLKT